MSSFSSGLAMESSVFYMEKSAQAERALISALPEFHGQREISAGGVARRAISRECPLSIQVYGQRIHSLNSNDTKKPSQAQSMNHTKM